MTACDDPSRDYFLGGRVSALQPRNGFRSGTDAVFLAAAVPAGTGDDVLELGCGAGVAALCLVARTGAHVTGLELQADYADLARRNAGQGLTVIDGDVGAPPVELRSRTFDHVMFNPPYYAAGAGPGARDGGRETALRENLPIAVWLDMALRRLRPGGSVSVIVAADRLGLLLSACDDRLGRIAVLPLVGRPGRDAKRVILQGVKGSRAPLRLLSPLVLHPASSHGGDDGAFTAQADAVLREAAALTLSGPRVS